MLAGSDRTLGLAFGVGRARERNCGLAGTGTNSPPNRQAYRKPTRTASPILLGGDSTIVGLIGPSTPACRTLVYGVRTWCTATIGLLLLACATPSAESGSEAGSSDTATDEPDPRLLILPDFVECDDGTSPSDVRVATWNMGAARGSSIEAVRDVLADANADVVIIQEIEIGARRTDEIDQPGVLADALGYQYAFGAALKFDGGDFGMAVFSRLPFREARRIALESSNAYEPRIAIDATVCAGSIAVRLIDVHADFMPDANLDNLGELAGVLGPASGVVIAGDFNANPNSDGVRTFVDGTGTIDLFAELDPTPTREGERIDFVLTGQDLAAAVVEGAVVPNEASDHALLWVDFAL